MSKDLLEEVRELELAIEGSTSSQVASWLVELLKIKKARLSVEVFFGLEFEGVDELDEPETEVETINEAEDWQYAHCARCGKEEVFYDGSLRCLSCGWVGQ
jgi:hypothetical protein